MDEACAPRCFDWKSLEEVSFSYQIVAGERVARLSEPGRRVVLADRSPVVPKARAGLAIDPLENSANHARRGQNVLFTDGSVEWFTTPMRSNQDNIWLPASRPHQGALFLTDIGIVSITIHGNEIPRTPDDAFVGP